MSTSSANSFQGFENTSDDVNITTVVDDDFGDDVDGSDPNNEFPIFLEIDNNFSEDTIIQDDDSVYEVTFFKFFCCFTTSSMLILLVSIE